MSELCLDRNFKAINKLQKYFSFENCYEIIKSDIYPYTLRTAFTKLVN
jgi:hypothetical protein